MRWVRTEKGKEYRRQAQKQGKDLTPFNDGYRELVEAKEPIIGCITNALQKDALLKQEARIRRLTPTECERLQGFPDGWTEGVSDTQRYKCLGNAVTVNVVYEVAQRLSKSGKDRVIEG
jgi:site-specific DNA-cytosine methylase